MDAFEEFRLTRDAANEARLPSFTYKGKRYARKKSGKITVYKRVSGKKRRTSRRR